MWCLALLLLLSPAGHVDCVSTVKCSHDTIVDSLEAIEDCVDDVDDEKEFCEYMEGVDHCWRSGVASCFRPEEADKLVKAKLGDDAELEIFFENDAEMRKVFETCVVTSGIKYDNESDILVILDFVTTDNDCTESEKTSLKLTMRSCFEKGDRIIPREISQVKSSRNLKASICEAVDEVYGYCLRPFFPPCFSSRDRLFVQELARDALKDSLDDAQDALKSEWESLPFIVSDCLERVTSGGQQTSAAFLGAFLVICLAGRMV